MRKKACKSSIRWVWIGTYLIILLVPLLFSHLNYEQVYQTVEKNAFELNQIAIARISESITRLFENVRSVGRELITREDVTSLLYANAPLTPVKLQKLGVLQDDLRVRVTHSNIINQIYLLFNRPGVMASTIGYANTVEKMAQLLKTDINLRLETLLRWLEDTPNFQIHVIRTDEGQPKDLLAIMTSSAYENVPDVALLFRLDIETLRQTIDDTPGEDIAHFWLEFEDGLRIVPDVAQTVAQKLPLIQSDAENPINVRTQDGEYIVTTLHNELTGLNIISAVSKECFAVQLSDMQGRYMIYFAFCLCFGVGMTVYFASRQYKPVQKLSALLKSSSAPGNEYLTIERSVQNLLYNARETAMRLQAQEHTMRETMLARLLRGTIEPGKPFEMICTDYKLHFRSTRCMVLTVLLRDDGGFLTESGDDIDSESEDILFFALANVTEELIAPHADALTCKCDGALYVIVCAAEDTSDADTLWKAVRTNCELAQKWLSERCQILTTYFVSDLQCGGSVPQSIHAAYLQACWALEQIEGFGLNDAVLDVKRLRAFVSDDQSGEPSRLRCARLAEYISTVKKGALDQADLLYQTLRYEGVVCIDHSFANVRLQTMEIFEALLWECLSERQLCEHKAQLAAYLTRIRSAKNMDSLRAALRAAAKEICQLSAENPPAEDDCLGRSAMTFIQQSYQDPNLSVAGIAEHFGVSPSFLLRSFKKTVASGSVLDFIQRVRIDQAKLLLRNDRLTVAQVAQQVGYSNSLALIRTFKKLEGATPTTYRNVISLSQSRS